jgi:hypothetical protein
MVESSFFSATLQEWSVTASGVILCLNTTGAIQSFNGIADHAGKGSLNVRCGNISTQSAERALQRGARVRFHAEPGRSCALRRRISWYRPCFG